MFWHGQVYGDGAGEPTGQRTGGAAAAVCTVRKQLEIPDF